MTALIALAACLALSVFPATAERVYVPNPSSTAPELHTRSEAGHWTTDPAGRITTGTIANDCGYSFFLLPQTVERSSFTVSVRVRFRIRVDYSGAGLVVLAPNSTSGRMPHLRLELSERQDQVGAGGWLEANENHYPALPAKPAGRDIRVGEWYRLLLRVDGTRVRGYLDDELMLDGEIAAVAALPATLRVGLFIIEADAEFADLRVESSATFPGPRPAVAGNEENEGRPGPGPGTGRGDDNRRDPGPGGGTVVLEEQQVTIGAQGGAVVLANGARFEVPAGTLDRAAQVRVIRSAAPGRARAAGRSSDMYTVTATAPAASPAGGYRLVIPYDPAAGDLGVYACKDGSIYPAPGVADPARGVVVIDNPRVSPSEPGGRRVLRRADVPTSGSEPPPRTGYILAALGFVDDQSLTGAAGETFDPPNSHFRIMTKTQATPDFVRYVANTLEEAYRAYVPVYTDENGKRPLADLSTGWWRMEVYLCDNMGQTYGEYRNWDLKEGLPNGYWWWPGHYGDWENIYVNVPTGAADRPELRETLFHEFFHALQDEYGSKFGAWTMGTRWWYEATAEWAGWHYGRNQRLADAAAEYVQRYPQILSVPIEQSSTDAFNPELHYGYSLLVDHVETVRPGYVHRALISGNWSSGNLYAVLVNDGNLAQTYPAFVRDVLAQAIPAGSEPWDLATIHEYDDRTEILRYSDREVGSTARRTPAVVRGRDARRQPHVLEIFTPPLTTKFVRVRGGAVSQGGSSWTRLARPRTAEIMLNILSGDDLTLGANAGGTRMSGVPAADGWIVTANPVARRRNATPATPASPRRIDADVNRIPGLGRDQHEAWIAIVNPDPYRSRTYRLSVRLLDDEETVPAPPPTTGGTARQTIINPTNRPVGRSETPGPAGLGRYENEVEVTGTSIRRHSRYIRNDGTVPTDYSYEFSISGLPERSSRERQPLAISGRLYGAKIPPEARHGVSFQMNTGVDAQGNGINFTTLYTFQVTAQNPTASISKPFRAGAGDIFRFVNDGWVIAEYRFPASNQ